MPLVLGTLYSEDMPPPTAGTEYLMVQNSNLRSQANVPQLHLGKLGSKEITVVPGLAWDLLF